MLLHTRQAANPIEGDPSGLQPGVECDMVTFARQRAALRAMLLVGDLIERSG